jgi:hypothetical protein
VLSVAKNRPPWLWDWMQHGLRQYQWHIASKSNMIAISYYARKNGGSKKIVNFLTNVPSLVNSTTRKRWNRKLRTMEDVPSLRIITEYNQTHGYEDKRKQVISHVRNPFRAHRAWRAEANSMIYRLLHMCYIWHTKVTGKNSSFPDFIVRLIYQISSPKIISTPVPHQIPQSNNIISLHELETSGSHIRCIVCRKRTRKICNVCMPSVPLHEGVP